jgi:hypothetical protein
MLDFQIANVLAKLSLIFFLLLLLVVNITMFVCCNMNEFFSFDLFMVYIPECKQQLRTLK